MVSGVNIDADRCWAVPITPLTAGGWYQLHRWRVEGGVNDTDPQYMIPLTNSSYIWQAAVSFKGNIKKKKNHT
jgi:hypothetical protein